MRASFDNIFTSANAGTDVVVQSSETIGSGGRSQVGLIPESLTQTLAQVPEAASAEPTIQGTGQITAADGKPIGGDGPPTLAGNWIPNPALNPVSDCAGQATDCGRSGGHRPGCRHGWQARNRRQDDLRTPELIPVTVWGLRRLVAPTVWEEPPTRG